MASSDAGWKQKENVELFLSSPAKTQLSPASLGKVLPPTVGLKFYTMEREALSPLSAALAGEGGRKVVGTLLSRLQELDLANVGQVSIERAEISSAKSVAEILSTLNSVVETNDALKTRLSQVESQVERLKQESIDQRVERAVYGSFALTRDLACISILNSISNCLSEALAVVFSSNLQTYSEYVGEKKLFSDASQVYYPSCWWIVFRTMEQPDVEEEDLGKFWSDRVGYAGNKVFGDGGLWSKRRRKEKKPSFMYAFTLDGAMKTAEASFMNLVGDGVSIEKIRNTMGCYISIIKPYRNAGLHLFDNLLKSRRHGLSKMSYNCQGPGAKELSISLFEVDPNFIVAGISILKDVIENIEKVPEMLPFQDVIVWYAAWLLARCEEVEGAAKRRKAT